MLAYLNYVKIYLTKINHPNKFDLIQELNTYQKMYIAFQNNPSESPIYIKTSNIYDVHNFHLPTNESFTISWDIERIYKKYENYSTTQYLTLPEFESIFQWDLAASQKEFSEIYNKIESIHEHTFDDILTIYFKPTHNNLIFDGRHRYTEFKKFKPDALINFSYFNSNDIIDSIVYSFDLVQYIIINNLEEINNFICGYDNLEHILHFNDYGLFI